jgi:1-acyl-sn-glycerol-3-phosphate acyltransferase
VRVAGNLHTSNSEVVRAAVFDGVGIGYSSVWLFGDELRSGKVSALLPDGSATLLPMHLVTPPARRHSAKLRMFGDCVAAALHDAYCVEHRREHRDAAGAGSAVLLAKQSPVRNVQSSRLNLWSASGQRNPRRRPLRATSPDFSCMPVRAQDKHATRATDSQQAGWSVATAVRAASAVTAGLWRLGLLGQQIVRGALIVHLRFGRLDSAQRHAHIAAWAQGLLQLLSVEVRTQGELRAGPKLIVANHVSWLDIVVIHALCPQARFVSKAVVRDWPLIGRLVTGARTLLVDRQRRRDTARALDAIVQALNQGDTVALFPEGTTSDGAQVLDFHSSLLHGAVAAQVGVQPVALRYSEGAQALSPSVPYIGTTSFIESLWRTCMARDLIVTVRVLDAVAAPHADRRTLARELRRRIVAALDDGAR